MRSLMIVSLCLGAAACSEGEAPKQAEAAASLEAGLWEASSEISAFRSTDGTTPVVKAAVGDKSSVQACVSEADKAAPPAALFGGEGYDCSYKSNYIRGGRINVSLDCSREGVVGSLPMQVEGTYTGASYDATVTTQTYLPGSGDFAMTRKVSGRRTAPSCPPDLGEPKEKAKT